MAGWRATKRTGFVPALLRAQCRCHAFQMHGGDDPVAKRMPAVL